MVPTSIKSTIPKLYLLYHWYKEYTVNPIVGTQCKWKQYRASCSVPQCIQVSSVLPLYQLYLPGISRMSTLQRRPTRLVQLRSGVLNKCSHSAVASAKHTSTLYPLWQSQLETRLPIEFRLGLPGILASCNEFAT